MEIKDLKVGMKFIEWSLGYPTSDTHKDLPESLRKFFIVNTIEKVNKVSFIVNGQKATEVPRSWKTLTTAKPFVVAMARRYFSDIDEFGRLRDTWYKKEYTAFLATLSPEERDQVFSKISEAVENKLEGMKLVALAKNKDALELTLGLREPRWDEI